MYRLATESSSTIYRSEERLMQVSGGLRSLKCLGLDIIECCIFPILLHEFFMTTRLHQFALLETTALRSATES
jgi:hypothetical protein